MKKRRLYQRAAACVLATALLLVCSGVAETGVHAFYTDVTSLDEALAYSANLNIQLEEEGIVLLQNNNHALPLTSGQKVTLFGNASYESVWGETGGGNHKTDFCYLPDSLTAAGLTVNPKVQDIYRSYGPDYRETYGGKLELSFRQELPVSLMENVRGSYLLFGDAAILTIARNGHEDFDIPTDGSTADNGAYEGREHANTLQLENNELAMIEEMRANFDKVIVLLNVPSVVEIGDWAKDVDAILYIGLPGQYGMDAVGRVLTGEVNPSGRTVDTFVTDLSQSPSFVNSINNTGTIATNAGDVKTIEYEEGIYIGYKYYETVYAELTAGHLVYDAASSCLKEVGGGVGAANNLQSNANQWYDSQVAFPFGYGLSYTTFSQSLVTSAANLQSAIASASGLDDIVEVSVRVRNTGAVAGKEVVQLYVTAPYTSGGIEKAAVSLAGFAKTSLLAPGEEQTVVVPIRIGDLASFDYNDANKNGFSGYELEKGTYTINLQSDSHTVISRLSVNVGTGKTFDENGAANNTPFSNGDDYDSLLINANGGSFTALSRAHMVSTFPTAPNGENEYTDEFKTLISSDSRYVSTYTPENDLESDPWYVAEVPSSWTQRSDSGSAICSFSEMSNLDYTDNKTVLTAEDTSVSQFVGQTPSQAWELFMNSLSWDEMVEFISSGGGNFAALESAGVDKFKGSDGPEQLSDDGTFWSCAAIIAGAFNRELWYLRGVAIGNESLLLGSPVWYGPAVNIHRTQFNGRNYIYFSEDGYLSGMAAAEIICGAQSKGLVAVIKHIVLNDQETDRKGNTAWITEQALREIYLKPFELAIKAGGKSDTEMMVMSAMNRVGAINCYSNYQLLVEVLRNEWGFTGAVITDTYDVSRGAANYIQRAGGDIPYGSYSGENSVVGEWDPAKNTVVYTSDGSSIESPTQWAAVRSAAMHLLQVFASSNATRNNLNTSLFQGKQMTIQAYVGATGSIAVDESGLGGGATYAVSGGGLPEGVALSRDGSLTGMASQAGTYQVDLSLIGDGWVTVTQPFTIEVLPFLTASGGLQAQVGNSFTTTFTQDAYSQISANGDIVAGAANLKLAEGETATLEEGKVVSYSYELLTDVPGLTMSEDGTLSGTPTLAGTYPITVRFNYLYMTDIHGPGKTMFNVAGPAYYDSTYELVVTASGAAPGNSTPAAPGTQDVSDVQSAAAAPASSSSNAGSVVSVVAAVVAVAAAVAAGYITMKKAPAGTGSAK